MLKDHLHLQAANTRKSYRSDLHYFWAWAKLAAGVDERYPVVPVLMAKFVRQHLEGLDPEVEEALRAAGAKRKAGPLAVATIERRVAAVRSYHRRERLDPPVDRDVLDLLRAGRRARAESGGQKKKRALIRPLLERLLGTCTDEDLTDVRDAAVLLVGWGSGGRRRSEIAAIQVADVEADGEDYTILVTKSKTDQEGRGARVPVAGRAASALRLWLAMSSLTEGALFRHVVARTVGEALRPEDVTRIVQRRAELAGFPPGEFGAHSLRSGFLTQAGRDGIHIGEAMRMSLHKDVQVALGYHEAGATLKNPAARLAG